jgi:hypothetical protein
MRTFIRSVAVAAVLCTASFVSGKPASMDLYLLIGQSNMAGRGIVEPEDQKEMKNVLTLNKENEWVPAVDPIHFDKKAAGVGPGRTFGIIMAEEYPNATIGLIPCAVGGTSIRKWKPEAEDEKTSTHPYDDMLVRLKVAMKSGEVKGILWHQGEADGKMGEQGTYAAALTELIERVRTECGSQDIPFVIGQLGQFEGRPWSEGRAKVNEAQQQVAKTVPYCAFVSSDGLSDRGDLTHFNAEAARELGMRYAQKMIEVQKTDKSE